MNKFMNKIDIEKINRLKSHKDFYQSMINQFYNEALELYDGNEDIFMDYFMNDIHTLDEIIDIKQNDDDVSIRLTPVTKHRNGDISYTFEYTENFKDKLIKNGIENPTEEDIGEHILERIKKLVD